MPFIPCPDDSTDTSYFDGKDPTLTLVWPGKRNKFKSQTSKTNCVEPFLRAASACIVSTVTDFPPTRVQGNFPARVRGVFFHARVGGKFQCREISLSVVSLTVMTAACGSFST